ncbi:MULTISPECIES: GNAT family N-acetyltransferase [unclassified Streptomyces]|uniref:GNAT family N-acetyltransferase n=1 Tax=unclassified Streptomyces TaxID=2593676 RepID=UPI0022513029|nr:MULTISPECIES: GNAT family N-acetyltransferase [unclassified Streptomyces]MCX4525620.1 GNAT family N-acetyltransferase [Streptomyces sp. NBC_01551]MCX4543908.1 GNAT family N-acetyltransferase [Streptomyces sp. NBC_01565]
MTPPPEPPPPGPPGPAPAQGPAMEVLVFAEAEVPAGLAGQVAALEGEAWPGATPGHDPALAPRALLLVAADGTVAASLALLFKEVRHAGRTYRAAGLSAVVTRKALRGRGHGALLVAAARRELAAVPGLDLVLFSCDRPLAPFYEAAGFTRLPGAVLVGGTPADPLATDEPGFDKEVLAEFLAPDAGAAAFEGTRIALYPGPVDRLW